MKKTIENLMKAFIGESMARNRYTFYAKQARTEGYEQLTAIFLETADNEREHAKILFKLIQELKSKSKETIDKIYTETEAITTLGNTVDNLKAAIEGENYEYTKMYPEFADIADKEKLPEIAKKLRAILIAEKHHEERYKKLLEQIENKTIFKKDKSIAWVCRECGYIHTGIEPPKECPACGHEKGFYQRKLEEY